MTNFQFCFWNYSIWINKSWQIISSREVENGGMETDGAGHTEYNKTFVKAPDDFRLLSSKCCWSECSFVSRHSDSHEPHDARYKYFVREKNPPFSNIFWETNSASRSPVDRDDILRGSTIALNCIPEPLLSRHNCFFLLDFESETLNSAGAVWVAESHNHRWADS